MQNELMIRDEQPNIKKMGTLTLEKPDMILCDIEGTTTSISFVKDFLFPFVRNNLRDFLRSTWNHEDTEQSVKSLLQQYQIDQSSGHIPFKFDPNDTTDPRIIDNVVQYVFWLMDQDKKLTALKQLQGKIWQHGYENGKILGHVYDDVPECFKKWTNDGIKIGIYSSGSVLAQKLLFGHSKHGDLCQYISCYFDTKVGAKQDATSYEKIIEEVNLSPSKVVFLTDVPQEAKAARKVGIRSNLLQRPGVELSETDRREFPCIKSFDEIVFK